MRTFDSAERKWTAIAASATRIHQSKQPLLVGTRTISESEIVSEALRQQGVPFQLLNGLQDADEAQVVEQAGDLGAVTIATNLAGRGTDIKLSDEVRDRGGLHVIVAECHESARVDRQLIGRSARQGDPGSAQCFASADDLLFQLHSPWLADTIRKIAINGEVPINLEPKIRKIQDNAERMHYAQRLQLFQSSERDQAILR